MNVTINGKQVNGDLAKLLSMATRTQKVGDTVIDSAALLGITVEKITVVSADKKTTATELVAKCPAYDELTKIAKADAIVHVEDEGKNPQPRNFAYGDFLKIIAAAIAAYPHSKQIETLTKDVNGLVKFETPADKPAKKTGGFDFSVRYD